MVRLRNALAALAFAAAVPVTGATPQQRTEAFAQLPYWPGYWVSEEQTGTTIGGSLPQVLEALEKGEGVSFAFLPLASPNAPWNAEGAARNAAAFQAIVGRKSRGWGFPMMMNSSAPLQFLITPEEVLIVNPYGDIRHVYIDGRALPAGDDIWPTVWGTSIGHWEGDTLVIETVKVEDPSRYFHGAPPLSDEARYTERLTLRGERLEAEITIDDPETLERPWLAQLKWVRDSGYDRMLQVHYDNDRTGFDGQFNTIEPASAD